VNTTVTFDAAQPSVASITPTPITYDIVLQPDGSITSEHDYSTDNPTRHLIYATPDAISYWNGAMVSGCQETMNRFAHISGVFVPDTTWPMFDSNRLEMERRESEVTRRETSLFERESELVKRHRLTSSQLSSSSSPLSSSSSVRRSNTGGHPHTFSTENETEIEQLERLRAAQRDQHQKLKEREEKVKQREEKVTQREDDVKRREEKIVELEDNLTAKSTYVTEMLATRQAKVDAKADEQRKETQKIIEERLELDARETAVSIKFKKLDELQIKVNEELQKLESIDEVKKNHPVEIAKLEDDVKRQTSEKKHLANLQEEALRFMKDVCDKKNMDKRARHALEASNSIVSLASQVYKAGIEKAKEDLKSLQSRRKGSRPTKDTPANSEPSSRSDNGRHNMMHTPTAALQKELASETPNDIEEEVLGSQEDEQSSYPLF
jgi:DNA repair exonuclease SbcCD ATPase subunit